VHFTTAIRDIKCLKLRTKEQNFNKKFSRQDPGPNFGWEGHTPAPLNATE